MKTNIEKATEISKIITGKKIVGVRCPEGLHQLQIKFDDGTIISTTAVIDDERPILNVAYDGNTDWV